MEFTQFDSDNRKKADVLIIPFWKNSEKVERCAEFDEKFASVFLQIISQGDFKGKEGEIFYLFDENLIEKRVILLGLGDKEKVSVEILRRAYGNLTKFCMGRKWLSFNLLPPQIQTLSHAELLTGIVEGILLVNYKFKAMKKIKEEDPGLIQNVCMLNTTAEDLNLFKEALTIANGIYLTRDLVNGNADDITPTYLKDCALDLAKRYSSIKATIFDKTRLKNEKLDLILAVNRGADSEPYLIILNYQGQPQTEEHTILVGKGVTYDTGGLNLKPTGSIESMKCDMAGAAACLGAMQAVASLELNVNFTIIIPTTENSIDASSFKPGDVYSSYSGKSVEVTNTDAEGRLILADALAYASKNLEPTYLIDIATLTGAIDIALGAEAAGIMSTNDQLAHALCKAGEVTAERLWRMPLFEEYKERLKSDFADLKSWNGRGASANVAATFLSQFVDENIAWAHLDIASTAYLPETKKYWPKYATGVGVRLIVEFLKRL